MTGKYGKFKFEILDNESIVIWKPSELLKNGNIMYSESFTVSVRDLFDLQQLITRAVIAWSDKFGRAPDGEKPH